ncbi:hypothetical protein Bbelb_016720 [Branchiostoma belcheri]|nr:hypothetical protein Bbelb_016720 [Branchiostoma belcheri]
MNRGLAMIYTEGMAVNNLTASVILTSAGQSDPWARRRPLPTSATCGAECLPQTQNGSNIPNLQRVPVQPLHTSRAYRFPLQFRLPGQHAVTVLSTGITREIKARSCLLPRMT